MHEIDIAIMGSKRRRKGILEDLVIMVFIHGFLVFIYTVTSTHYNNNLSNHHGLIGLIKEFSSKSKYLSEKIFATTFEPNYPKITRVHYFPTFGTEKEMAKHDRYLVHGMLYSELLDKEYLDFHWYNPDETQIKEREFPVFEELEQRKVCINILMKNRPLPYINSLIMTLMMSHTMDEAIDSVLGAGHRLLSYVKINILDTEKQNDDYDDLRLKVMNLPFVQMHSVQSNKSLLSILPLQSRRLDKIEDYIASSKVCIQSNLPWCLMMEEFTVVPIHFLRSLKRFVIAPLESYARTHMHEDDDAVRSLMSVLTLFSTYNEADNDVMKIHDINYSMDKYHKDRGMINSERRSIKAGESLREYEMYSIPNDTSGDVRGGFGSAMLFSLSIIQKDVLPMLESLKKKERKRLMMSNMGVNIIDAQGEFDLEYEIHKYTKRTRYRIEPSLVNRIGFYDDVFAEDNDQPRRLLGITNWFTDPRFVFDAGEYWEGRKEWCSEEKYKNAPECKDNE